MGDADLGLVLVVALVFVATGIILNLGGDRRIKHLLLAGLWLRVAGSLAYFYFVGGYYGGGDYNLYLREGLNYATLIWSGNFSAVIEPWLVDGWWGTSATIRISGLVLSVIGPTREGAFIVFGMISYVGIIGLWAAYRRAFPGVDSTTFLKWLVFFPSLWFWPAALGKDAIVLCGVGLATFGFVGRERGGQNWIVLALGVLLVFTIRPQVAAVLVFALIAGHWMSLGFRWRISRVFQGIVLLAVGIGTIALSGGALGLEMFDPEEVEGYFDEKAGVTALGGSAIEQERPAPWVAPVNTLFRPFIWEARGLTPLLSAIEVLLIWSLVWTRRREIRMFVRHHRGSPLFWFGISFAVVYAMALGMSLSNMGMIARQRVHILPFVLMLLVGLPGARRVQSRIRRRAAPPAPAPAVPA